MKKKLIWMIVLLILIPSTLVWAEGEGTSITDELIDKQLEQLNIDSIQEILNSMELQDTFNIKNVSIMGLIKKALKGEIKMGLGDVFMEFTKRVFKELILNTRLLSQLMVVAILTALIGNLSSSFGNNSSTSVAFYACYMMVVALGLRGFMEATTIATVAVENMVSFMQALTPVLLTLLTAAGSVTASTLFKPLIFASIGFTSTIIKNVVIPLTILSAILAVVTNISDKINVSKLATFIKQLCLSIFGLMLTIFFGVMSVQGIMASSSDGVVMRTARYASDRFVPIVGGFLSEALDTVMGCSLLIKNAVGLVGLVILLMIILTPIIKVLSLIIVYKIATAVIEPISESKIVDCLNGISSSLVLLLATIISASLLFIMAVTIIVGAGNITAMIR